MNRILLFTLVALCASLPLAPHSSAQAPTAYHPGDVVSFRVKFVGNGVDKMTGAQVTLKLESPVQENQKAFVTLINANAGSSATPGVFEASMKIPDFVASGTYKLLQVSTGTQNVGFTYTQDLPTLVITIENRDHLEKPELESVEKISHP